MDSRERVIRVLARKYPDRVPMMDALWEDTITRWYDEGLPRTAISDDVFAKGTSGITDYFGFDFEAMSIDASPRLKQRLLADDGEYVTYKDRFGYVVKKAKGKSRTMDFLSHVTADRAAWEAIKERFVVDLDGTARIDRASYFMHMAEYPTWAEAEHTHERIRRQGRYLLFNAYGPWEATWRHRGFTQLLMDLVSDPDFVVEMAQTYTDLLLGVLDRCLAKGIRPDGFFLIEDLAYTRGMLMSPATWRRLFKPLVRQVGQFLHRNGLTFWMHCCGNAEPIFDDLIECGLQVIQPLEAKSGLDVRVLKEKYGDRLTFFGNIDVRTMAGGTNQEIEEEIRTKITPFVRDGGGYIYHSDHSVPPEVSFQRYNLVLDLVRRYGSGGGLSW